MAASLIDVAVDAGADAVKFQTYRPETVYVPNAGTSQYLSEAGIEEDISEIFADLAMPYEMLAELAQRCRSNGIRFMSTPFSQPILRRSTRGSRSTRMPRMRSRIFASSSWLRARASHSSSQPGQPPWTTSRGRSTRSARTAVISWYCCNARHATRLRSARSTSGPFHGWPSTSV